MRAVPTSSRFVSFFLLVFAACLDALPARAEPEPASRSTMVWGTRGERDPLLVVWIPATKHQDKVPASARLALDERSLPEAGRRVRLGPQGLDAMVWSIPVERLPQTGLDVPSRFQVTFNEEGSGGAVPPIAGDLGAWNSHAAVLCLECTPEAREGIDQLLQEGAGARDQLHPSVLEVSGARIYPNPMNPLLEDATLVFTLSEAAEVEVTAYDWNGDYVDTVFEGDLAAGGQTVFWGGQTEDGRKLGNGVYLMRIVARTGVRQESQVVKAVVWNED